MKPYIKYIFFLGIFLFLNNVGFGQNVLVKIYTGKQIPSIKFRVELGKYVLIANKQDTLLDGEILKKGDALEIKTSNNKVNVRYNNQSVGNYSSIKLASSGFKNIFCVLPSSGAEKRTYDDNLVIKANNKSLDLFNDVDPENYIAGVVQSEIYGNPELIDIFKVQAIISRTYALRNINKHKNEGYNLCDEVHCQVYKNRCIKPEVLEGALNSKGEIIVDSTDQLIDAPFHSNSGGQTANSEDVWVKEVFYLRSKPDTFSVQMKNATWEKKLSANEWLDYFAKKHSLNIKDKKIKEELLNFTQDERKATICSIPLKTVRSDLKLRSAFFSVIQEDEDIKLLGKGYGHGVGLSQEGAIRMVELGYGYKDVLLYYYQGAKILCVDEEKEIQNSDSTNVSQ